MRKRGKRTNKNNKGMREVSICKNDMYNEGLIFIEQSL